MLSYWSASTQEVDCFLFNTQPFWNDWRWITGNYTANEAHVYFSYSALCEQQQSQSHTPIRTGACVSVHFTITSVAQTTISIIRLENNTHVIMRWNFRQLFVGSGASPLAQKRPDQLFWNRRCFELAHERQRRSEHSTFTTTCWFGFSIADTDSATFQRFFNANRCTLSVIDDAAYSPFFNYNSVAVFKFIRFDIHRFFNYFLYSHI